MAKQVGPLFFTGTIDGIIFYKVGDKYYSRSKGSYKSAKHMRRNPKYKRTMENADRFGMASTLVREVYYQHIPKALRKRGVYGKLTGKVRDWLQEGRSREEALVLLIAHCQSFASTQSTTTENKPPAVAINAEPYANKTQPLPTKTHAKQTRYLSKWKVKRSGRLHVPRSGNRKSTADCVMLRC
jgi:hypothetical protein